MTNRFFVVDARLSANEVEYLLYERGIDHPISIFTDRLQAFDTAYLMSSAYTAGRTEGVVAVIRSAAIVLGAMSVISLALVAHLIWRNL